MERAGTGLWGSRFSKDKATVEGLSEEQIALIAHASAMLARLDERLSLSPATLRDGWKTRAILTEAAASARLNGMFITLEDLRLAEFGAYDGERTHDLSSAVNVVEMLRSASRRSPRQMFTPLRILAIARLRLRDGRGRRSALPYWLQDRLAGAEDIRDALSEAISPEALSAWRRNAPIVAAADLLARWHGTRCADVIGAAPGRLLAAAWIARAGLTSGIWLMPSVGFMGHAADYRPFRGRQWTVAFAEAVTRSVQSGLHLHRRLTAAHQALLAAAHGRRSTSSLPRLVDLLMTSSVVTAASTAKALGISQRASNEMLEKLRKEGPSLLGHPVVNELAGRDAFRVYGVV